MRNPERIEPMLEAIGHLWSSMPDLRLGQLMMVLAGNYDLFNIEDENMMQLIEGFPAPQKSTTEPERNNG